MSQKVNWDKYAKHPAVTLILGDVGSGKTSIAAMLIQHYHDKGLKTYMLNKPKNYPKWVGNTDLEAKIPDNCVLFLDDAHLAFYARDWVKGKGKILDFIARERRHGKHSIIYTTQQGRVLDVNLISMSSCLVFRRPSLLQLRMERPEIKQMFVEADAKLAEKDYGLDWAYVNSGRFSGLVEVGKPPGWFTKELSETPMSERAEEKGIKANSIFKFIAGIGKYA